MEPASAPGRSRLMVWAAIVGLLAISGWFLISRDRASDRSPQEPRSDTTAKRNVPEACRDLLNDPVESAGAADLTLTSANVVTMDGRQRASQVVIRSGRIAGTEDPKSSDTTTVDLDGATALPGFIDSHSHWIGDRALVSHSESQAIDSALAQGWTSISELFVNEQRLNELCALQKDGDLRTKVGAFVPINYEFQRFGRWYDAFEPGQSLGPHLFLQGVKIFADRAEDGLGYQTEPPTPPCKDASSGNLMSSPSRSSTRTRPGGRSPSMQPAMVVSMQCWMVLNP